VGAAAGADTSGATSITAPLVGTYYRSPEPGAKPFVEVGDVVEPDQEVGIIEAMKIMNRIVAETGGRVAELVANDGDMVEFGQPLILLEPLDAE
jgi:acetyl-CoA carboxylase biotin carboxyl carrier protein